MPAQQVGVPSTKRRIFVAFVRNHPSTEDRLIRWKGRLTNMRVQLVTLGGFIGREGSYLLNRKQGERRIFSFEDPILLLTRGHILGEKPPPNGYQSHPSNESSLEDAPEFYFVSFTKITTGLEGYVSPPTFSRSAIATLSPRRLHSGRDNASCSNLSPCHGCTTKSSHGSTGLVSGGLVLKSFRKHS